jgi:hypothetical protein
VTPEERAALRSAWLADVEEEIERCRPNVQMSVPSNIKMSVSPAFWRALGGDSSGGAERERCRTEAS